MKWIIPPIKQIYEALGCIADERIEIDGNSAKVYSSSKGKFYSITYNEVKNAIMSNDNTSYWKGYLGYPSIAFLMKTGKLTYDSRYAEALKGISWKDINVKFKNDFDKTDAYTQNILSKKGLDIKYLETILRQIMELDMNLLGPKTKPPEGY